MNAVVKEKSIETIYNHNVTEAEILQLTNGYPESKEEYIYALGQDSAYADLYRLYAIRHETDKAFFYLEQIQDSGFKNQFKMRPCCAVHS